LHTLHLEGLDVQLFPNQDGASSGVLQPAGAAVTALTQLQLLDCNLQDGDHFWDFSNTLPNLQHVVLRDLTRYHESPHMLDKEMWQHMQGLTHLELQGCVLHENDEDHEVVLVGLGALQVLTNLRSLRLDEVFIYCKASSDFLADMSQLTMFAATDSRQDGWHVAPGLLAGKINLQHLSLDGCRLPGLLSDLQQLTQLTQLDLENVQQPDGAPAAAYAALTASSQLHSLRLPGIHLPAGAWGHMFTAPLPHLTELDLLEETVWRHSDQL
jgi:hypothetical protein